MQVEPWGDDRADLRAAVNTMQIVLSQAVDPSDEFLADLALHLRYHTQANKVAPQIMSPEQMRVAHS